MTATTTTLAFYGTLVHSTSAKEPYVILEKHIIAVQGRQILLLQPAGNVELAKDIIRAAGLPASGVRTLAEDEFLMPGLIDTHIHAPQYTNVGVGCCLTLLDWLDKYTFPAEAKFADPEHATKVYQQVVRRTLKNGTTTASYFATIHLEASLLLAKFMSEYGQRGFVGKVCMDQNFPENYGETTEESVENTRVFIEKVKELYGEANLIEPCVTPRFAITCTDKSMKQLAELAKKYDVPIQTHMSENNKEIEFVLSTHRGMTHYSQVYEEAGLLTKRTILAHCVFSDSAELSLVKKYGCGIAHCPNSNITLRSGAMNASKLLAQDIKVGLGE